MSSAGPYWVPNGIPFLHSRAAHASWRVEDLGAWALYIGIETSQITARQSDSRSPKRGGQGIPAHICGPAPQASPSMEALPSPGGLLPRRISQTPAAKSLLIAGQY